jgi:hypothetical protein
MPGSTFASTHIACFLQRMLVSARTCGHARLWLRQTGFGLLTLFACMIRARPLIRPVRCSYDGLETGCGWQAFAKPCRGRRGFRYAAGCPSIEDSFETAKNEFGLDHNETRSWHGWHRRVSLVMMAFAMMAAIRHQANQATSKKPKYPSAEAGRAHPLVDPGNPPNSATAQAAPHRASLCDSVVAMATSPPSRRAASAPQAEITTVVLERSGQSALADAEARFLRSLDEARRQGALSWELRTAMNLARLWSERRRRADAGALLRRVYLSFTEGKCPRTIDIRDDPLPLPLSGAGKILKAVLRQPFWEGHERRVHCLPGRASA